MPETIQPIPLASLRPTVLVTGGHPAIGLVAAQTRLGGSDAT